MANKLAIIKTGGKQYSVKPDDVIFIEKIEGEDGDKVTFDKVLLMDGKVGNPFLNNAKIEGTIEKQGKQKKIVIFKYKPKKRKHVKQGHRQPYTRVKIGNF